MKILAGFEILVDSSSKHVQFVFKRKHTHTNSRLRKRINTIGNHDPVVRFCVQGVEVVVIWGSTKDVEIFLDDSTSMITSNTWWITCSINSLEGLVVDVI